jgi:hypothetical protein
MTTPLRPAEIFDAAVAAWRPAADAEYSPELVDEILRKHRHHLIRLIEEQTSPVLSLSQAVIERRLEDEAAELRRIRQVAVDPHALYHLALRLEEIAAPAQKTPEEILEYFRRHGFERISDLIATYLRTGGPVGPLLRSVAAQLRVGDEHDAVIVRDPGEEDESMAVPEDTLLGVDRDWRVGDHGHVLRQDPEGVSLHESFMAVGLGGRRGDEVAADESVTVFEGSGAAPQVAAATGHAARRAHTIALACAEGRPLSDLDLDHSDPAHLRPGETDPYRHSHHNKRKGPQT